MARPLEKSDPGNSFCLEKVKVKIYGNMTKIKVIYLAIHLIKGVLQTKRKQL